MGAEYKAKKTGDRSPLLTDGRRVSQLLNSPLSSGKAAFNSFLLSLLQRSTSPWTQRDVLIRQHSLVGNCLSRTPFFVMFSPNIVFLLECQPLLVASPAHGFGSGWRMAPGKARPDGVLRSPTGFSHFSHGSEKDTKKKTANKTKTWQRGRKSNVQRKIALPRVISPP